ncbi:hypothetical protein E6H27_03835 [Candidatus Bathyarchaeota archaeon]|nr:MAG: hypothetical protein E6H27_03835 [Candidatus Bathyarchaeota archaeon]TMI60510.1 MAG: hypothetical protein E6H14_00525 [Candidatus Bathyarchaeota archaeon]
MTPKPKTYVRDARAKLLIYVVLLVPVLYMFLVSMPPMAPALSYGWFAFPALVYGLVLTFVAATGELYTNRFWKEILRS